MLGKCLMFLCRKTEHFVNFQTLLRHISHVMFSQFFTTFLRVTWNRKEDWVIRITADSSNQGKLTTSGGKLRAEKPNKVNKCPHKTAHLLTWKTYSFCFAIYSS